VQHVIATAPATPVTRHRDPGAPASTSASASVRWLGWLVPVALCLLVALAGWLRLTPLTRNTVWAEDAARFLGGEFTAGTWGSLFQPYAGYLHLVPRIIADVTVHAVPAERYAVTLALLSCLVTGAVGAGVYVLAAEAVRSRVVRVVLAFVPALIPLGPVELMGNTANVHSYLMFLSPFVVLAAHRSWWRSGVLGVVAFVIACTEIQSLAFLPFLLLRIRSPKQWPIALGLLVGGAMQVWTTLVYPRPESTTHDSLFQIAVGYVVQPFAGSFTWHTSRIGILIADHGWFVLVVPFVLVLAFVLRGAWLAAASGRLLLAALAWGSAFVWAASIWANDPGHNFAYWGWDDTRLSALTTVRYAAAASLFVIAAVLVAADATLRRRGILHRGVGVVVVVVVLLVFAVNVAVPVTHRSAGPSWASQVEKAVPRCRADPTGSVRVLAAPNPSWGIAVPCPLVLHPPF
jgi:hypothetical protein